MDDFLAGDRVVEARLALGAKDDFAILEGKKGMILAHADIAAREDICSSLADNDLAIHDVLAMVYLDPKMLGV